VAWFSHFGLALKQARGFRERDGARKLLLVSDYNVLGSRRFDPAQAWVKYTRLSLEKTTADLTWGTP